VALKVRNGSGSWDVVSQLNVRTGSGWSSAKQYVYNGASWVQVHPGVQLQSYGNTAGAIEIYADDIPVPSFGGVTSEILLTNSGTAIYRYTTYNEGTTTLLSYNWLLPNNTASDYYAKLQILDGSVSSGSSAVNTLVSLGDGAAWNVTAIGPGAGNCPTVAVCTGYLSITNSYGTDIVSLGFYIRAEAATDTVCGGLGGGIREDWTPGQLR